MPWSETTLNKFQCDGCGGTQLFGFGCGIPCGWFAIKQKSCWWKLWLPTYKVYCTPCAKARDELGILHPIIRT